mgnify:CR=1 FL=1|jgi:hypothetical protein
MTDACRWVRTSDDIIVLIVGDNGARVAEDADGRWTWNLKMRHCPAWLTCGWERPVPTRADACAMAERALLDRCVLTGHKAAKLAVGR